MAFEFRWNNPAQAAPQGAQVPVQPQPQPALPPQQAAGMGADVQKLNEEYARNEARIAQLENELRTLKSGMSTDDEFQDALAANRAKRGDTGFYSNMYFMRQNRANSDQALADEKKQRDAIEQKKLVEQIEDLDMNFGYLPDKQSKGAALSKRRRLVKELEGYGVKYAQPEPDTSVDWSPDEWEQFRITNTDKDGKWNTEEAREKYAAHKVSTAAEAEKAKTGANTDTAAEAEAKKAAEEKKAAEANAKEKREAQGAISEVVGTVTGYTLAKNKGTVTKTASNGRSVTVTKTPEGILYQCGKEKKLVKE